MERNENKTLDSGFESVIGKSWEALSTNYRKFTSYIYRLAPKSLFGRTLLIFLVPIILLQAVVAFVFMERHWELVTKRLSEGVARDIAVVVNLIENVPTQEEKKSFLEQVQSDFEISLSLLPKEPLPKPRTKLFFSPLDRLLSESLRIRVGKPFWIDTVGNLQFVETRILLNDGVLRVVTRRSHTYASNSHIFLVWMVSTSILLITVAILFLRNQIKPIQRLANAADAFGKGREVRNFRPSGSREIRRASRAFIEMRNRLDRQIEQRTTMLAGVSHDLRTILTRFQLQLALIDQDSPEVEALQKDIKEMNRLLEAYLDFAKEDEPEESIVQDIPLLLEELEAEAEISGLEAKFSFTGDSLAIVKPVSFKRCLTNLIANACRYATKIEIVGEQNNGWLTVTIHDNGPGIPEEEWENAFRPFYRLDTARNQDQSSTGLGLSIALDIARGHGGSIIMGKSYMNGLAVRVRIPT